MNADLHIHLGDKVDVDLGNNHAAVSVQTNMGTLTLSSGSGSPDRDSKVDVWAHKLEAIENDSSSDINLENVQQRDMEIILNGSGAIHITGHVENLIVTNNGSGDVELEDLVAENVTVKVNSAGSASVNVRRSLIATNTGTGDIKYRGNPGRVIPKVYGAGSVEKL